MKCRFVLTRASGLALYVTLASFGAANAQEQSNIWKECGSQYQAAKAAEKTDGRPWRDFLKACRLRFEEHSASQAQARVNTLKECGVRYRLAKAANELRDQNWADYLKACQSGLAARSAPVENAGAPSVTASVPPAGEAIAEAKAPDLAPVAAAVLPPAPSMPKIETPPAAAPAATREKAAAKSPGAVLAAEKMRQNKCAAQWKTHKNELKKTSPSLTWARYWRECNRRLQVSAQ